MFELRIPAGPTTVAEIERKRSRFITWIRRVSDEAEARAFVAEARSAFPDARHHCTAWVLCPPDAQPIRHSSDDGEPSGTAGRPMLDVLVGADIGDVAVIVTRYFGGTLLGTGGLVRAYSDAVAAGLAGLPRLRIQDYATWSFDLDYAVAARVEAELRTRGWPVEVEYCAANQRMTVAHNDGLELESAIAALLGQPVSFTPGLVRRVEVPAPSTASG